jgi:hypothetical protein
MLYMMSPLEQHYDDGFGAVADAFQTAAESLQKENDQGINVTLGYLPEVFLRRHAIELFLKSCIIIVHRRLRLPYGKEAATTHNPHYEAASGHWKPLLKTHSIPELYAYWKKLMEGNKDAITALTTHKPDVSIPRVLDAWISDLAKMDPSGDYFRYPISRNPSRDPEKSLFKEVDIAALFPPGTDERPVRALVMENADGLAVRAFRYDHGVTAEFTDSSRKAADMLSCFNAMMRCELTDGW